MDSLLHEATIDPLTKVANRKLMDDVLGNAIENTSLDAEPLSYILLDIDHFKKFNDTYGHQIGDHALQVVAATLSDAVKGQDTVARYGGEEFAIILPKTKITDADKLADGIASRISKNGCKTERPRKS